MMENKEMSKEEFKVHLEKYLDLHLESGAVLVTSPKGNQYVYVNVGNLMDDIRLEKELLKDKIKVKNIRTMFDKDEEFQKFFIDMELEGEAKTAAIQTRQFTDEQIHTFCDKVTYILNGTAA